MIICGKIILRFLQRSCIGQEISFQIAIEDLSVFFEVQLLVVSHLLFESGAPFPVEVWHVFDDLIRDVGKVHHDHNKV